MLPREARIYVGLKNTSPSLFGCRSAQLSQNGMPLLIRDVFHERKNPIMKKGPHCGRGSAECFGILVRKKNTLLDVHGVQVMRESIPKEAALESSGVAGFHGRWNHWNVSGVHEPSFRAEGP